MKVLVSSFGYKHGLPPDADFVFDVRCLANPHWVETLRALTGRDAAVIAFLDEDPDADRMFDDIRGYLETWLPRFAARDRAAVHVAIGCTGGQHRSVYMAERLARHLRDRMPDVSVRHTGNAG